MNTCLLLSGVLLAGSAKRIEAAAVKLEEVNPLTRAVEIMKLTPEALNHHFPVRIEGFVTCYDYRNSLFFVQDNTSGVYIYSPETDLGLRPGERVKVEGVAQAGRLTPIVLANRVTRLIQVGLPEPRRITPARLATGADDSQWVEIDGVTRSQREVAGQTVLELSQGMATFRAYLTKEVGKAPRVETNVHLRLHGVVGAAFAADNRVTGYHIYVPGVAFLQPVSDGGSGTNGPSTGVSGLAPDAFVTFRGQVRLHWPGELMIVNEGLNAYRLEPALAGNFKVGSQVEVRATTLPSRFGRLVRPVSLLLLEGGSAPAPAPAPLPANPRQILAGRLNGDPIVVEGMVLASAANDLVFPWVMLQSGGHTFQVLLPVPLQGGEPLSLSVGSSVRVTGVGETDASEHRGPGEFRVLARDRNAFEVLRQGRGFGGSPWIWMLGGAGAVAAGVTVSRLLRQGSANARGNPSAPPAEGVVAFAEHFPDALLRVDATGMIHFANPAAKALLGFQEGIPSGLSLIRLVSPRDWDKLREVLQSHGGLANPQTHELEMVLSEGRALFVASTFRRFPPAAGGMPSLIDCTLRDLTETKRVEAALTASEQQLRTTLDQQANLARDLHDNIIQSIYATGLGIESARLLVPTKPRDAEELLTRSIGDLNRVLRDIRCFLTKVSSDALDENDLESALQSLVVAMSRVQSIRFILDVDPLACGRLDGPRVNHLVHVAQEAMSNCIKHSHGKTAIVSLRGQPGGVRFEVRDDGCGFDASLAKLHGHGLRNIASRAQELGATFEVNSQAGKGVSIVLSIPIPSPS